MGTRHNRNCSLEVRVGTWVWRIVRSLTACTVEGDNAGCYDRMLSQWPTERGLLSG